MKKTLAIGIAIGLFAAGFGSGQAQTGGLVPEGESPTRFSFSPTTADTVLGGPGSPPVPEPTIEELLRPRISPTRAVLMTPVFPGWGQLYAQNSWRAALAFAVQGFYWSNLLMNDRKATRIRAIANQLEPGPRRELFDAAAEEYWERMRDFSWWYLGGLLITAIDAYVGAHLFEFTKDPLPVPSRWPEETSEPPRPSTAGSLDWPTVVVFQWRFPF
jgi:hypothetical protein